MFTCLYAIANQMLVDQPEECETIESFIVPVLKELDWPIRYCGDGVCLRRKTSSGFDLTFTYKKTPLLAIECKRFSTNILKTSANKNNSSSNHRLPEQVNQYFKKIRFDNIDTQHNYRPHVIWTNGAHWIVFKEAALIGNLGEEELYNKFKELKTKDENNWFRRISLLNVDYLEFSFKLQQLSQEIGFERIWREYSLLSSPD